MLMARTRLQELLERVRIDWLDTGDAPESLRAHARSEVQLLSDGCKRMRALSIEHRSDVTRLVCNCLDRKRAIRVVRPTLREGLRAFADTARARCWG